VSIMPCLSPSDRRSCYTLIRNTLIRYTLIRSPHNPPTTVPFLHKCCTTGGLLGVLGTARRVVLWWEGGSGRG